MDIQKPGEANPLKEESAITETAPKDLAYGLHQSAVNLAPGSNISRGRYPGGPSVVLTCPATPGMSGL